jgi:hypothetical protein
MANIKRANASSITKSGVAIADVPDAPTIGAVTDAGTGTSVTVAYTAATTGGAVTTFTATSTPGSITGTGSSPITVSGLTAGTAYTFKVKGTNSTATGPESAASASVTPVFPPASAYDSIATSTGTGSASSFTFSGISSAYTHLQIRLSARGVRSFASEQLYVRLNGDGGNNYSYHSFTADGSGIGSAVNSSVSVFLVNEFPAANETANVYSSSIIDILDANNANKYTTMRSLSGYDNNGNTSNYNGTSWFGSGLWMNTASVTSVTVLSNGAFATGTKIGLFGIKGA